MVTRDEQTEIKQVNNRCDGKEIMMPKTTNTTRIDANHKIPKSLPMSHNRYLHQ